jgi:uncharacterized protein (DUF983 family)
MIDPGPSGPNERGQPGLAKAALFGLCPQCHAKTLFAGPTNFSDICKACGLDYRGFNVGDGPAALLTLAIGAVIILLALTLDVAIRPPFWVHALIWVPVTAALVVVSLRAAKGALLILEYRNQAGEGTVDSDR